ncbi:hypothetical protein [Rhodococcoides fascians]|uniref:hypothetical protein n=1 Tax=Rhodococcoides fascians TaxID=1828 RepID=UPI00050BF21F|nr:hypothetical protein [Rhodococcus fascians]
MGLDLGRAQWAYSGFNRFRTKLAGAEGINLDQMDGYAMVEFRYVKGLPWTDESGNDVTVLRPFLDHSDCDGELTWEECAQVVDRIEEIVATWDPEDRDTMQGRLMVEDMRECVTEQTSLRFG